MRTKTLIIKAPILVGSRAASHFFVHSTGDAGGLQVQDIFRAGEPLYSPGWDLRFILMRCEGLDG